MESLQPPRWVWWALLFFTGLVISCMTLAGLLGIGGNVVALLSPEGMLEKRGQSAQPQSQQIQPQNSGFDIISPFSCKWVTTKRQHTNRAGKVYLALDLIPEKVCDDWTLYAVVAGKVELVPASQDTKGYGNHIVLRGDVYTVLYAHMASFAVKNGDEVAQGTPLGQVGNTGNVIGDPSKGEGIHLHTEVAKNGVAVDPYSILPQPTEAMATIYKQPGQGVLVQVPERSQPQTPGLVRGILQGLANLIEDTRELPAKIAGDNTRRDATVGDITVKVVDERTNKEPLDPAPDARLIAQKAADEIPDFEGDLVIAIVDRICDPGWGCFAGQMVDTHRIELDPQHQDLVRDGLDRVLAHELGHVKDILENRQGLVHALSEEDWVQGEIMAEEYVAVFAGVTTSDESVADLLEVGDELIVLVFTQPGDIGTNVLRPQIERLRFLYPWVEFQYIDATTGDGRKLAEQYFVSETPTTVLTRGGKDVWTWVGSVEGLEEMLEFNRALGEVFMMAGKVPFTSESVFAGVYGALCAAKGSLGVLGKNLDYPQGSGQSAPACNAVGALEVADRWAQWVAEHDGRTVVRVLMPTVRESSSVMIDKIIAECGQRNEAGEHCYVMLDLQSASEFDSALQRWVTAANPQVGFVLDIEWFGGRVAISSVNRMAEQYFQHRQNLGLRGLGLFGVWYFNPATVLSDEPVTREWERDADLQANYASGIVVPIMDGIGSASAKLASYNRMMQIFQAAHGGMMGFTWRWGFRYDSARPEDIFRPDQLFWTQQ